MTVTITEVAWARDHRHRAFLDLEIDGHPAHIRSRQKTELIRRGIVAGIVFFASERSRQLPNRFMRGDFRPELTEVDLIGCTDDPRVFALYEEMCRAIRAGAWRPGPRPYRPEDRPVDGLASGPHPGHRGHVMSQEEERSC
jgi:hypothetical protein